MEWNTRLKIYCNLLSLTLITSYSFHQNSDFMYLTGWNEPDSICVLEPCGKMTLFVPPKIQHLEIWDGPRTGKIPLWLWSGIQGAKAYFGADDAQPIDRFPQFLKSNMHRPIYSNLESHTGFDTNLINFNSTHHKTSNKITPLSPGFNQHIYFNPIHPLIDPIKAIKSKKEIDILRTCGKISGRAFQDVRYFPLLW